MGVSNASKMPPLSGRLEAGPREGSRDELDPLTREAFPVTLRLNLTVYALVLLSWILNLSH